MPTAQERYDQLANEALLFHCLSERMPEVYRELAELGEQLKVA